MSDPELVELLRAAGSQNDLQPEQFPLRVFLRVALTLLVAIPVCFGLIFFLTFEALGFLFRSAAPAGTPGLMSVPRGSCRSKPAPPPAEPRGRVRPSARPSPNALPVASAFEGYADAPGDGTAAPPTG